MADSGIVDRSEERELVGETGSMGCLLLAAIEGFRSWAGEGSRFMELDWMAEAISMAGEVIVAAEP